MLHYIGERDLFKKNQPPIAYIARAGFTK